MTEGRALRVDILDASGEWMPVGTMYNYQETNWFEFFDSYWGTRNRPILGQIFEERGPGWRPKARVALPYWFSHLLPEGRLRRAVAAASEVNSQREFDLLLRIGPDDLPGAVRAVAIEGGASAGEPVGDPEGLDASSDPILKFSLAGAQMKFSVLGSADGLVVPARGSAGNFILKCPQRLSGIGNVAVAELGCLELSRSCGIDTPPAFLINPVEVKGLERWAPELDGNAIAISRFDRRAQGGRVHMEELAQVLNVPTVNTQRKYEMANFEVVSSLVGGLAGLDSVGCVIDRIVLNIAVGNGDAHLKNWALTYPESTGVALSPVYDVVPTVLYMPDDDLGLNLGGSRVFGSFRLSSFDQIGVRTDYGPQEARRRAGEMVQRIRDRWSILADYLPKDSFIQLSERLDRIPMMRLE